MTLVRKPFEELMTLPRVMDRFFEQPFFRPGRMLVREFGVPAVDVKALAGEIIVEAALPGVKPEDVEITVDGDVLTIKGTCKHEEETEESGFLYRELSRGEFSRAIPLPATIRAAEAKAVFQAGMLTLTLPKAAEAVPTKVAIQAG